MSDIDDLVEKIMHDADRGGVVEDAERAAPTEFQWFDREFEKLNRRSEGGEK